MWEGGVHIYGTPGVPNNFPTQKDKKENFFFWELTRKKLTNSITVINHFRAVARVTY